MKPFVVFAIMITLTGCSSEPANSQSHQTTRAPMDEEQKPPFVGMTKAQAIARYGQPKKKTVTDEGEQWVYILNFGEYVGKHMIPFFFSSEQVRTGVLTFGPDGRVKKYHWDRPTE